MNSNRTFAIHFQIFMKIYFNFISNHITSIQNIVFIKLSQIQPCRIREVGFSA